MKITNKVYPEVIIHKLQVPEFDQEVKVENGIVYVIVRKSDGKKYWVRLDELQTIQEANKDILRRLIWELSDLRNALSLSKAEMKRRLVDYGVVSR